MPSPTHIYFQTSDNSFTPFLWFQNNKANEMLLGIYGFKNKAAKLRYIYPEHEIPSSGVEQMHYKYKGPTEVDKPVDHITCYADGRLHIKTNTNEELYIQRVQRTKPLGAETSVFLDFTVVSDIVSRYSHTTSGPEGPYCFLRINPDELFSFRCMFSGVNYALEKETSRAMSGVTESQDLEQPAIMLKSGSMKGFVWGHTIKPDSEGLQKGPRGTVISFKFPAKNDKLHLKAFLFE